MSTFAPTHAHLAATAAATTAAATTTTTTIHSQSQSHISTLQAAGLFIPAVRAIVQEEKKEANESNQANETTNGLNGATNNENKLKLEFSQMSAGTIADLAHVQFNYREQTKNNAGVSAGDDEINIDEEGDNGSDDDDEKKQQQLYYEPLKPMELPIGSRAPHIEPGRVDIRIMSLMDSLRKIWGMRYEIWDIRKKWL